MKGRSGKARKTKGRSKAAKAARGRSSKSKKSSKTRKPAKAAAKRKTGRKQATPRKKTSRKTSSRGRARKDIFGEGNYTASREFRRQETGFVQRNRNRIPKMGEQAAEALESDEGRELRQAEETARSHSAGDDGD